MSDSRPDYEPVDQALLEFMQHAWPYDPAEAGIQEFAQLVHIMREIVNPIIYNDNVWLPDMDADEMEGNCFARSRIVWTVTNPLLDVYPTLEYSGKINKSGRANYHAGDAVSLGGYPYLELPYGRIRTEGEGEELRYVLLARKDITNPEDPLGAFAVAHDPAEFHIFDDQIAGLQCMELIGTTRALEAESNYMASAQELLQYASLWPQFGLPAILDVAAPLSQELQVLYTPDTSRTDATEQVTMGVARIIGELSDQAQTADPLYAEGDLPWHDRQPYIGSLALVEAVLDRVNHVTSSDNLFELFQTEFGPGNTAYYQ